MQDVRSRLVEATFLEVFSKGYAGASLSDILKRADVKKGAMYHYFSSKKELVITAIEEKLAQRIEKKWENLSGENLIDGLIKVLNDTSNWDLINGCPLGNLLQESLDYDEDFSKSLTIVLDKWKEYFINILKKAKDKNQLKNDVDEKQCATFIIASIEGALLLTKKYKTNTDFESCMSQLTFYLNSLKQ